MTAVRKKKPIANGDHDEAAQAGSLADFAFQRISSAIVRGRLDFGEPLSEGELAKALNLSKAPVRAAIVELKKRKLVDIVAQSGTYVVSPTADDVRALCRFRFTLEKFALESALEASRDLLLEDLKLIVHGMRTAFIEGDMLANKRLDADWHWAFVKHANNRHLAEAYAEISLLVEALRYRFMDTVSYRNQAFEEHQKMLDLLASEQKTKAVEMLRAHIERTERYQTKVIWSDGPSPRRLYRLRDYAAILATEGDAFKHVSGHLVHIGAQLENK